MGMVVNIWICVFFNFKILRVLEGKEYFIVRFLDNDSVLNILKYI